MHPLYFIETFLQAKVKNQVFLYFIREFLQAKVKNRVFLKLESRYEDYFTERSSYFGRALILLKYMYVMTNSGKLVADDLTE